MKFAVNYSTQLVKLLEERLVKFDLFKCPDWEWMIKEAQSIMDVTIHFDLKAGLGKTLDADFSRIKEIMEQTNTPHVNTHLVTPHSLDPDSREEISMINQLWRDEIHLMTDSFGRDSVTLEHFPYTLATPYLHPAVESTTFSQVILDTDCQFLLDLAHARITAETLSMDVKDYIRSLPLDRLVEMHTTGIKLHEGILTDHFPLETADWELMDWALGQIQKGYWQKPRIIAFEYGGVGSTFDWRTDSSVLETQVIKLYEMIQAYK